MASSEYVVAFSHDAFMEGVRLGDIDSIVPAHNTVLISPTMQVSVLIPYIVQSRFVLLNVLDERARFITDLNATDVLGFQQSHVDVIVFTLVMVRLVGEGICTDHRGSRLVDQGEVELG